MDGPACPIQIDDGTCHVLFACDIGFGIDLDHASGLLSIRAERGEPAPSPRAALKHTRRAPKYFDYTPRPLVISRAAEPISVGGWKTAPAVEVVAYDFGVLSVRYEIQFAGSMESVLALGLALYENAQLQLDARRHVQAVMQSLLPAVSRPDFGPMVEDYFVYQVRRFTGAQSPAELLSLAREHVAGLLRSESGPLAEEEVRDAVSERISYSPQDATVIDWNAAMVVGEGAEDILAVLEFANVELLEMRFLDEALDRALSQAYETAQRKWSLADLLSHRTGADLRRIARFQVDSAILFEGVNNALKLVGDQYLARLYRLAANKLHLPEWDTSILRKLGILQGIYDKLSDRQSTRRLEVLEWIVIALIAFEVAMGFVRL